MTARMSGGFSVKMVVAITEPTATVTAKSKLDNLEKDLSPASRVKPMSAIYIPTEDMITIIISVQLVVSHE